MFLDVNPDRHWGDPAPSCRSCKAVIRPGDATEHVQFPANPGHGLEQMNGIYHAACAKHFLSMARMIDALSKFGG